MKALDRFNQWLEKTEPDEYNQTWAKVRQALLDFGYKETEIEAALQEIRHWLFKNEDNRVANKKHWGKFIKNWLRPKTFGRQSARLTPSKFD